MRKFPGCSPRPMLKRGTSNALATVGSMQIAIAIRGRSRHRVLQYNGVRELTMPTPPVSVHAFWSLQAAESSIECRLATSHLISCISVLSPIASGNHPT